jgi:antitoxin (DNA-binding transcriptional repressor) of toxin-antitoxin stability system
MRLELAFFEGVYAKDAIVCQCLAPLSRPTRDVAIDMANSLAYKYGMKTANIGELKDNLSKYIGFVEKGEVVAIHKRNIPIALLVPHRTRGEGNRTRLGCGRGTVRVKGDLTEPLIPEADWDMHHP